MSPRLTPPPRVEPRATGDGRGGWRIGWKTVAGFVTLVAVTFCVFAFLPRWIEAPSATEAASLPQLPPSDSEPETDPAPAPEPRPVPEPSARPEPAGSKPAAPPSPPPAPVESVTSEVDFTAAMSSGMTALSGQDYRAARAAFERALALRPDASEALDSLAQAEERLRLAAIADHRERGEAFEATENWRRAETEYDAVLALEPTLRFALTGKDRTKRRAELAERLAFHLGSPERLSDAAVLDEAARLLREAEATEPPTGPKHGEQIRKLAEQIEAFSAAVVVELHSDGVTEVTVYRVGRLGAFTSRSLELRAGRYTVVGSREGYRDVRRELVVPAGARPEPLVIRCEERIR